MTSSNGDAPKAFRSTQRIVGVMGCAVVGALAGDFALRDVLPIPGDIALGVLALALVWLGQRIALSGIVASSVHLVVRGVIRTTIVPWRDVREFKSIPSLNATANIAVETSDGRTLKTGGLTVTRKSTAETTILSELEALRQEYTVV